ncbi:hypothetical protein HNQ91_002744 [Filimonas zeae]|uniref:Uncharacterized protein n=1 Tax=Filimonas zeae TaxID=1737353 RepID=A0A917J1E5_9BACT|nr:hypothetical protein [Filimonas zeae]GGH69111.1 hypothetical protein GCM10011379_26100 [Filimonas zeae]
MDNRFIPLVTCVYKHSYYNDGKLKTFRVFPGEDTAAWLVRNDVLFRQYEDRFTIYYNSLFHGRERSREELCTGDGTILEFYLQNNDAYFAQYTEGVQTFTPGKALPVFSNTYTTGFLHGGEAVSGDALEYDSTVLQQLALANKKPYACLRLHLTGDMQELYTIQFTAKATYWRYVLAAGHLQQLQNPAVIARQGAGVFTGPEWVNIPGKDKVVCFVSADKIVLSEIPKREWQLVEQYDAATGRFKVVKKTLPAPDISHISVLDAADTFAIYNYSEIIL